MRHPWRLVLAALLAAVSVGCGGDGPDGPPGIGVVTFELETPYADDGALLVSIQGGVVDSIVSGTGRQAYLSPTADSGVSAIVTGAIGAGPLLTAYVPDAKRVTAYTATVVQAAARTTYALRDPSQYRLIRR